MMSSSDTPLTAPITIDVSGPPRYAMDSDSDHKHVDTVDHGNASDIELQKLPKGYKKIKDPQDGITYQSGFPVAAFKEEDKKVEPVEEVKFTTLPSLKKLYSQFTYNDKDFRSLKTSEQVFEKTIKFLKFYEFDNLKEDERLLYCKLQHNIGKFYLHIMDLPEKAFETFRELNSHIARGAIEDGSFNDLVELSIAEAECQLYIRDINAVEAHLNYSEAINICDNIPTDSSHPKYDPYIHAYALYILASLQSTTTIINFECINNLTTAINLLESLKETDLLGRAMLLRAICYGKISKFDVASEFAKVMQYYSRDQDCFSNLHYANALVAFGDYQLFKEYSNPAMHLTPVINAIRQYKIALQVLDKLKLTNPKAINKHLGLTTKTRDLIAQLDNKVDVARLNQTIESLTNMLSTTIHNLNLPSYVQSFPHAPSAALTRVYDNKEENDDDDENNALIIQPLQEASSSCSYIFGAFMNLFRSADPASAQTAAQANDQTLSEDDEPMTIMEHLSSCVNKYCRRI